MSHQPEEEEEEDLEKAGGVEGWGRASILCTHNQPKWTNGEREERQRAREQQAGEARRRKNHFVRHAVVVSGHLFSPSLSAADSAQSD